MKKLLIPLVILLICSFILTACGGNNTTAPAATSAAPPPKTTAAPAPTTTIPMVTAAPQPTNTGTGKYGGTMKVIFGSTPANIGYFPDQTFQDVTYGPTWSDRLFDLDTKGNLVPNVALSYDYPANSKVIVLHLRPNVKFQDGTPFTAAAVKWTMDESIKTKTMPGAKYITSIEAVDDLTVKVNLTGYNSIAPFNMWRPAYYSPTAYEKNGKEWAKTHAVSTAAFKVTNFQPNNILEMSKWDGYWRTGRPYLDTVQFRAVPDTTTCMALIKSGQADVWVNAGMPEASQLRDAGFEILSGPNTLSDIFPDSKDPTSPFAKKEVREALEYALDKSAISDSLGYGFQQPVVMMAPPGTAGFNPAYKGRPYNVAKAKELLTQAGYPNGFKTNLLYRTDTNAKDLAAAVQNYLKAINIDVTLDPADPGRYWGSIFTTGWKGLLLGVHAINPQWAVAWLDHFGPGALIAFASLGKSQAFLDTADAILAAPDMESFKKATMVNVTQAGDDCMFIPIFNSPMLVVKQKWVNTTYTTALDWTGWTIYDDWVSPH
jgi:peptide/nickel transport system substrate-binding protein